MDTGFFLGGTVAAFIVIAGLGVWLAVRGRALRASLAPYVGEGPAGWLLAFAWAGYALGVLQAIANAIQYVDVFAPEAQPSAVQFLTGLTTGPILSFASWAATIVQIGAMLVAAVVAARVLRPQAS